MLAVAARCRGLVACAQGDVDRALGELGDALARHEEVTLPFQHARTLLALGRAQRQAAQRRKARSTLEASRDSFARLGAALWERRAQAELDRVGGRAPAADRLTPTELRVANLVVQGRTNREVAAALVVTERTVETHLRTTASWECAPAPSSPAARSRRRPRQRSWIPTIRAQPCRISVGPDEISGRVLPPGARRRGQPR